MENNIELLYGLKSFTYNIGDISRFAIYPTYSKYYKYTYNELDYFYLKNDNIHYEYKINNDYIYFLEELNYKLFDKLSTYLNNDEIIKVYDLISIKITDKDFVFDFTKLEEYLANNYNITIDKLNKIKDNDIEIEKLIKKNPKIRNILHNNSINSKNKNQIYKKLVRDTLDILSEYKYAKVYTKILNLNKIKADIADKMYNLAIENEKEKNYYFSSALAFLINYYDDNKTNYGNFHQSKISNYLNKFKDKQKKTKQQNNNIKKIEGYNYNFFEEDKTFSNEILTHVFKFNNPKNTDKLKKILKRKLDLYSSIGYSKIKVGKNTYDGYMGFVIGNKVILDRLFYDLKKYSIAIDNAIYIINEKDFDKITKLPKHKVIEAINQNLIDAKRIIHNGKYETKVLQYIKK